MSWRPLLQVFVQVAHLVVSQALVECDQKRAVPGCFIPRHGFHLRRFASAPVAIWANAAIRLQIGIVGLRVVAHETSVNALEIAFHAASSPHSSASAFCSAA